MPDKFKPKDGHEYQLTNAQKDKVLSLLKDFDDTPGVFSFEGQIFLGNAIEAAKKYAALNPSDKFFIWLQDNYKMLFKNDY